MNEFELFESIKVRNKASFDALFRLYYTPLCRFAFAICLSQQDAEESVQEMFVNLWQKAPTIAIGTSAKAYLYTATRNYTLNTIKKQQTELAYRSKYGDYMPNDDKDETISDAQIALLIESGVATLPPKCREIFILCKQEGLTYDEIATYLDVSQKTIENQMGIALRKLREYLLPQMKKLTIISLFNFWFWG